MAFWLLRLKIHLLLLQYTYIMIILGRGTRIGIYTSKSRPITSTPPDPVVDQRLHGREGIPGNLPRAALLPHDEQLLVRVGLRLPRRQHGLGAHGRGPRERPLGRHDDRLLDGEGDVELDGGEDARVGLAQPLGPRARREVRRHDHAVGRVERQGFFHVAALEGGAIGVEGEGYLVRVGGH
jgi:hypothetical protein